MHLQPGDRLGSYTVVAALGAGGMGEVYRARDERLGREVAIKVLPDAFASDPARLARFEREARLLATLNHPNVATIHGLEDVPDSDNGRPATKALVLELVEGLTLADHIAVNGRLALDDALAIARQITDALEVAHASGIVHRDLKPANVKVRSDGTVKVLDFGLAKAATPEAGSGASLTALPTITSPAALTGMGMLLGTAAYMSPEQARGKPVDRRADIWAFGCVLYEMLAGRRAFEAEDVSLTLAEVIKSDPDWRALPVNLRPSIRLILQRCLEKDPQQRFRDIGDVRLALDGAFDSLTTAAVTGGSAREWRRPIVWAGMSALAAALAVAALMESIGEEPATHRPLGRFAVALPAGDLLVPDPPALSPDGTTIIYAARRSIVQHLYRRDRDRFDVTQIAGTEGGYYPEFSPDGQSLVFLAPGTQIQRVPLAGGAPTLLFTSDKPLGNISWSDDGRLAFGYRVNGFGLSSVPASGGSVTELTALDPSRNEVGHRYPHWLPGSGAILFTVTIETPDAGRRDYIVAQQLPDGERRVLAEGWAGRPTSSGHVVFLRGSELWAAPFDVERLALVVEPRPVQQTVTVGPGGAPAFAVSRDGMLVLPSAASTLNSLVWVDRQGREEAVAMPPRSYVYPRLSPDETRVALTARGEDGGIWVWDLARETLHPLTRSDSAGTPDSRRVVSSSSWTADSRRVAYGGTDGGVAGLFLQQADGSAAPEALVTDRVPRSPTGVLSDATGLLFVTPYDPPYDIGVLSLTDGHSQILLGAGYSESNPSLSPDGRWMAYESNESGRAEIYVRPFPDVQGSRHQISADGGTRPLWSRDGRELFYYANEGRIMSVEVPSRDPLVLGRSTIVITGEYAVPLNTGRHYDVASDGRLLLLKDVEGVDVPHLLVALNWTDDLRQRFASR